MPDSDIKVGDVVRLKSGGPNMTVSQIDKVYDTDEHLSAWCSWFEGTKAMEKTFSVVVLMKAPPPSAPTVSRPIVRG